MIKPKKTIENLSPYQTDDYRSDWTYKLDSNENIYGASSIVLEAIKNIGSKDISLYPCYGELLDKLSEKYGVDKKELLLSNGCDEALNILIGTYLEQGDEILSYSPTFSMPSLYACAAGGVVKFVEYDEKFVFDAEKIESAVSQKTKIIYVSTPNNPTGDVVRASLIETLIKKYPDILFIIDCTYVNFAANVEFRDYLDLIKKYDNAAAVKSFSKDYALAGLRLGFTVADENIISNLKKIASPYNVNIVAIKSALAVLDNDEYFEGIKQSIIRSRNNLFEILNAKGFKPYESEGNFILCDFGNYCDFYYEKFRKNGVIVRKFSTAPLETSLRITVPTNKGTDYILGLLERKDVLIFDLDGVVFDVSKSYTQAILDTFEHFAGYKIEAEEVAAVKNLGGMNCDWDTAKCLLSRRGLEIELDDIVDVFQNLFFEGENKLIDKERLLISKETFEELSKTYDLAVFSGRLKREADYSLQKFGIDKYFYYFVTSDNLPKELLKPDKYGVEKIKKHVLYKSLKYFGDSVDDIISGNAAGVDTVGVVAPDANYNSMVNNFKHLGAKYILSDIKDIKTFLKETKEGAKLEQNR